MPTQSYIMVSSDLIQDTLGSTTVRGPGVDSYVRRVPGAALLNDSDGVLHMSCLCLLGVVIRDADHGTPTTDGA